MARPRPARTYLDIGPLLFPTDFSDAYFDRVPRSTIAVGSRAELLRSCAGSPSSRLDHEHLRTGCALRREVRGGSSVGQPLLGLTGRWM